MKYPNHKKILNSLRKYRKARGLTQKEIARVLRLKNTSTISRWESGFCLPNLITVMKLAVLYRTMVDGLFIDLRRLLQEDILKAEQKFLQNKTQDQNGS